MLKLEQLQHSGSFKARGAFANLLLRPLPGAGVVAASGGNHGAAVAYAAQALGVTAHVFVPEVSSPAKIERIRGYGADLVVGGAAYAEALAASEEWAASSGALPRARVRPDRDDPGGWLTRGRAEAAGPRGQHRAGQRGRRRAARRDLRGATRARRG